MDEPNDNTAGTLDDARFDRLVDGELGAAEYRALLASLDEDPDRWRRCALAFLENQALAAELGSAATLLGGEKPVPRTKAKTWGQVLSVLAVVASFLVAFALGIVGPRIFELAKQEYLANGNFEMQAANENAAEAGGLRHPMLRPIGNVQLTMDGPGGETMQAGQVPVYEVEHDMDQYLSGGAPALGPELIELLRQRGYDVQHEQQYFPAALEDGRQIVVPVDGYQITPVSRRY